MSKVSAVHFNPQVQPILNHNDRTNDRAHTITKDLMHLNEYSCSSDKVRQEIDRLYKEAQENFYKYCEQKNGLSNSGKPKGLHNFTKKEKSYHECIIEIDENTTMQQCQELSEQIAELTGFTPLQVVIHRDEGHKNEKGEWQTHYHAHAVFFTLDKNTGLQLARQQASLNKANLSKIQNIASQVLQMQRGKKRFENGEKQPHYIKDYKLYAQVKEQEKNSLLKLTEIAQKQEKKEKEIQDTTKDLKAKEIDLNAKENDLVKKQADYLLKMEQKEREFQEQLKDLDVIHSKSKNFWLNLITLGYYPRLLKKIVLRAKETLINTIDKEKEKYTQELNSKNKEIKELKETNQSLKKSLLESQEKEKKLKEMNIARRLTIEKYLPDDKIKERHPEIYKHKMEKELNKIVTKSKSKGYSL